MKSNTTTVKEYILGFRKFSIPLFQRKYIWDKNKFNELINELESSFINEKNVYLGTLFLEENSNKIRSWQLIDGQQRTTFLYIFLNSFKEFLKNEIVHKIINEQNNFIDNEWIKIIEIKKMFNELNNDFSITRNDEKITFEDERKSITKQKNNLYQKWLKRIKNKKTENNVKDEIRNIFNFFYYVFNKIEITYITLESNDSHNDVFESLNSKGKSLGIWDLIRNKIYQFSEDDKDNSKDNKLKKIDDLLEKIQISLNNKKQSVNDYVITSILSFKNEKMYKVNEDLYKDFTKKLNEDKTFLDFFIKSINKIYEFFDENEKGRLMYLMFSKTNYKQLQNLFFISILIDRENDFSKKEKNLFTFFNILFFTFYFNVSLLQRNPNIFENFFNRKLNFFIENNFSAKKLLEDTDFQNELFHSEFLYNKIDSEFDSFSSNKSSLYMMFYLDFIMSEKSVSDTSIKTLTSFMNGSIEHVKDRSNNLDWTSEIGNLIFLDKKLNKNLSKDIFIKFESISKEVSNLPNRNKRSFKMMYDFFEKNNFEKNKNNEWNEKLVKKRTEDIIKINLEWINSFKANKLG